MQIIERDLKYCPICKDEYRADIELCAACKTDLISGEELLAAKPKDRHQKTGLAVIRENDVLTILQTGSLLEMKKLRRLLSESGIPVLLAKDDSCGSGCCGPEIRLHIRTEDIAAAQKLLRAEHQKTTGLQGGDLMSVDAVFDPRAAAVTCPACGTEFSPDGAACPDCGLQFL